MRSNRLHQEINPDEATEPSSISTRQKWKQRLHSVSFWRKISVIVCMIAVSMDPLFFYIPFLDHRKLCLNKDRRLRTAVLITRSLSDFTFLLHILYQLREAAKSVAASDTKRKMLQKDSSRLSFNWFGHAKAIAKKLSWRSFLTDILAVLPIPHVLILALFYSPNYGFSKNKMTFNYMLLAQYVPRTCRIFTSSKMFRKNSGVWVKSAFYFYMYILSSHVIGAFWYFSSIQIEAVCWNSAALGANGTFQCDKSGIPSDDLKFENYHDEIYRICRNFTGGNGTYDYGLFLKTVEAGYTGRTNLSEKLFYFVWWGLKNISNYGTNIDTSKFIWENCFAILVSGIGLVLFALLIGNMQLCMQSSEDKNVATDKVKMKEQELQEWMDKYGLPEKLGKEAEKLRIEIMTKLTENLNDDQNAQVQNLFSLHPWDTVKDLKLSIFMSMLKKVQRLKHMDERGLRQICHYLKPVTYTEKTIALRMGEPLDSMLFIMEGIMLVYPNTTATTTDHEVGRANVGSPLTIRCSLKGGDVYGDEQLLSWASEPDMSDDSYAKLPIMTENLKCLSEVEGFVLTAKDLKHVVSVYKLPENDDSSDDHLVVEVERSTTTSFSRGPSTIDPSPRQGTESARG